MNETVAPLSERLWWIIRGDNGLSSEERVAVREARNLLALDRERIVEVAQQVISDDRLRYAKPRTIALRVAAALLADNRDNKATRLADKMERYADMKPYNNIAVTLRDAAGILRGAP